MRLLPLGCWQHEGDLHKLAVQLLEEETLSGAQINALLKGSGGKAVEEAAMVEEMVAETEGLVAATS